VKHDRPANMGALEIAIGHVLRAGVVTSSIALALGLLLTLIDVGRGIAGVVLATGLIVLMATPAARVAISVVEYARARDWTFVTLTVIVLVALAGSVAAAFLLSPNR